MEAGIYIDDGSGKPCIVSDVPVFYLYNSLEEAYKNEGKLQNSGLQYLRFEAPPIMFDAPVCILLESEVITRMHTHSNPFSLNEDVLFPITNRCPIKVPFEAEEFEEFLFALALLKSGRDLGTFSPVSLCSILKLADFFECPNLMRYVFSHLNNLLSEKSPSDVCEAFDIHNDFSQVQKQQMEREGLWHFNHSL
ncbi:hypothetical protein OSTOST_10252 [Ostertagia ostertagi]